MTVPAAGGPDPRPVLVRPRRPDDVPALAEVLLAQQAGSRYPFRDPLPVPVEEFLHADDAVAAWTAEHDGRPVGHVCLTGAGRVRERAAEVDAACVAAHGCRPDRLVWLGALVVDPALRGRGIGARLLAAAEARAAQDGLHPCLEVLPHHPGAVALYRSRGWREVLRLRPSWLSAATGDAGPDVLVMVRD